MHSCRPDRRIENGCLSESQVDSVNMTPVDAFQAQASCTTWAVQNTYDFGGADSLTSSERDHGSVELHCGARYSARVGAAGCPRPRLDGGARLSPPMQRAETRTIHHGRWSVQKYVPVIEPPSMKHTRAHIRISRHTNSPWLHNQCFEFKGRLKIPMLERLHVCMQLVSEDGKSKTPTHASPRRRTRRGESWH